MIGQRENHVMNIQHDERAQAHHARLDGGVEHAFTVNGCRLPPGVFERVHLPVENGARKGDGVRR